MRKLEGVVTSKGQLVIPAQLRRDLRIGQGIRQEFASCVAAGQDRAVKTGALGGRQRRGGQKGGIVHRHSP